MTNLTVGVSVSNLDSLDLYELYQEVGNSLDSIVSNMSQHDLDDAKLDIQWCQNLLDYLQERVEQELAEDDE